MSIGTFITIEGVEGVGKSTVAVLIKKFLEDKGKSVMATREPGGTIIAEKIRNILLHQEDEKIYSETELLLFFASRKQHVENAIKPALAKGDWVVCDRFVDASYAYQGGGRGISLKWIDMLAEFTEIPKPELTILLHALNETLKKRMGKRRAKDRIEKEKQDFFDRIQDTYLSLAKSSPSRYYIINADLPLDEVEHKIQEVLMEYL